MVTIAMYSQQMRQTMLLSKFGVDERYLAHTPNELLIDHSNLTLVYYNKIIKMKNLNLLIDYLIHQIDSKNFEFIKEMFINAVYLHDLGKKNPCFQAKKMNNPLFTNTNCGDSSHSHGGAIEFIEYYKAHIENIQDDKEFYRLIYILYSFAYHINQHHGNLNTIEQYLTHNEEKKSIQILKMSKTILILTLIKNLNSTSSINSSFRFLSQVIIMLPMNIWQSYA